MPENLSVNITVGDGLIAVCLLIDGLDEVLLLKLKMGTASLDNGLDVVMQSVRKAIEYYDQGCRDFTDEGIAAFRRKLADKEWAAKCANFMAKYG